MLGSFQQSQLRIAVSCEQTLIRDSLLKSNSLRKWLIPQSLSTEIPETLVKGSSFRSSLGFVIIKHHVEVASDNCLQMILSEGIDGYHEWIWGDGWVQSRLEGISLLPLNLGQTFSLLKLREFLKFQNKGEGKEN